jgi:hypothetical protein
MGMGLVLKIGENQKAPAMYCTANRPNIDATFIVLQERDELARRAYQTVLKKIGWPPN